MQCGQIFAYKSASSQNLKTKSKGLFMIIFYFSSHTVNKINKLLWEMSKGNK